MKLLATFLLILAVILAFQIYGQQATIRDQQNRLLDLQKQVARRPESFRILYRNIHRKRSRKNSRPLPGPELRSASVPAGEVVDSQP